MDAGKSVGLQGEFHPYSNNNLRIALPTSTKGTGKWSFAIFRFDPAP